MNKKVLTSTQLSAAGPYSLGIEAGGFIFISGQLPIHPVTGEIISDIGPATRQILTNLKTLLEENGLSMDNIVKTTIFIKDIEQFSIVNDVYAGFFYKEPPARSTVEVSAIPKGALLEIEAIAVRT